MSAVAVAAQPDTSRSARIGRKIRRALTASGWLAMLLGSGTGLLLAWPDVLSRFLPVPVQPAGVALAGAMTIGLLCGILTGLWLRGSKGLLRFMIGLLCVLLGVICASLVRGLLLHESIAGALTAPGNGIEAAEIAIGTAAMMVGIRAGRRAKQATPPAPSVERTRRTMVEPVADRPRQAPRRSTRQPATPPAPARSRRPRSQPLPAAPQPANAHVQLTRPKPAVRKRRAKVQRPVVGIHLSKQVTNVCPYCLEEVLPNDPRGIVRCEICGTPHHADCWAITGKCEVPHLQT